MGKFELVFVRTSRGDGEVDAAHAGAHLDQIPEVGMRGAQEDQTDLHELNLAFQRLPEDQQDALRLIAVEERSYEEVSDTIGCAIGTLKSRVHRARVQLRSVMSGEARAAA
jgi:RNA polymerase sigma-70 factor (ECF subfamily)